ncbi:hypothetical protein JQC91_06885 [Jannaschia sp. Os4]|uniref:hypothetical protein n=1 Tax=Jannaschia sp. Os4 TaxID=2807617 RepID=UPI00193A987C|nr:hypothetical protein [Jannaschia sp. Os4]MBM2576024.1 hypothetical protein [Jannaschia sp. Os4]
MSDKTEGKGGSKIETPAPNSHTTMTAASTSSPAAKASLETSSTATGGQQSSEKAAAEMASEAKSDAKAVKADAQKDAKEIAADAKAAATSVAADAKQAAAETGAAAKARASELSEKAKAEAAALADRAKSTASETAHGYKDQAASVVDEQASALRSAGREFGEDSYQARAADYLADGLSEAATVIRDRDFSTMMDDVEGFARRNPALFLGGAALLGFVGARLLKASDRGPRYDYDDRDYARMEPPTPGVRNTAYDTRVGGSAPTTADTATIGSATTSTGRVNGAAK